MVRLSEHIDVYLSVMDDVVKKGYRATKASL